MEGEVFDVWWVAEGTLMKREGREEEEDALIEMRELSPGGLLVGGRIDGGCTGEWSGRVEVEGWKTTKELRLEEEEWM